MHRYRTREVVGVEEMPLAVPAIQELGLFGLDSPWSGVWRAGDRVRVVAPNGGEAVLVAPSGTWALREGRPIRVEDEPLTWTVRRPGGAPDAQETFSVRARGFWQSHVRGAETLAEAVMRASRVAEGDRVMELYSGAGLFTRFLAQAAGQAGQVASLEGDEGAVADATANLEGWPQAETFVGTVDAAGVLELAGELGAGGTSEGRGSGAAADVVVLDPPRAGAGRDVCRALGSLGAPRVVLASCDPAAGARDLRALVEGGYALESLEAWDLFPHTHHVEFVAGLTRG
jgi:tRNA/tmRNA/rRNA uracil-C5-methylase (TrmA/RlmC/RlmD family)